MMRWMIIERNMALSFSTLGLEDEFSVECDTEVRARMPCIYLNEPVLKCLT